MNILVIDGQGGRIGASIIEQLVSRGFGDSVIAVGTNAIATSAMIKAGAPLAATGENAVLVNSSSADVITGPVGIIAADSLLGEVTPAMALAVSKSYAQKVLVPVNKCKITVAGTESLGLGVYISRAAELICNLKEPSE